MEDINWRFTNKLRSHWIKVKFYHENPTLPGIKITKNIRFCEATKRALLEPVLLNRESLSCLGAQYAFGWKRNQNNDLWEHCNSKRITQSTPNKTRLLRNPCIKESVQYIGLNTEGIPDVLLSYLPPEEFMELLRIYHAQRGQNLEVCLSPMMSICGGIAVRAYLNNDISISFGCNDSRKYADIARTNLAVGIPKKLFSALTA